jgi:DNA-directed RNA polymerase specialized sigma subunit
VSATADLRRRQRVEDPALTTALSSLSRRIRKRQQDVRVLEEQRNVLVARCLAQGMTHQQIADATGLSRGRISQLHGPAVRAIGQ